MTCQRIWLAVAPFVGWVIAAIGWAWTLEKWNREMEYRNRAEVRLAGCLTAADGHIDNPAKPGDYGWSLAYQEVLDLRRRYDSILREATK